MFRFLTIATVLAGTAAEATPTARCNAIRSLTKALVEQSLGLTGVLIDLGLEPAFAEADDREPIDYSEITSRIEAILEKSYASVDDGFATIDEFCTIKRP